METSLKFVVDSKYIWARARESALREGLHALRAVAVCMGQDVDFQWRHRPNYDFYAYSTEHVRIAQPTI
jgi:hypothetical protein